MKNAALFQSGHRQALAGMRLAWFAKPRCDAPGYKLYNSQGRPGWEPILRRYLRSGLNETTSGCHTSEVARAVVPYITHRYFIAG